MDRKLRTHEMGRLSREEFVQAEKSSIRLMLDNVRSAHNVGSIFRTADAFRCREIVLAGNTPVPPHPDLEKTALGATECVSWTHTDAPLEWLKNSQTVKIGVEITEQAHNLDAFVWPKEKCVLIFGHEVTGVSNEILGLCDQVIAIPQFGTKHSLNVSVTAGIVLWDHFIKKRA
jgi:23S rRNA (guanosine2251-2'-O)-methyltransferase